MQHRSNVNQLGIGVIITWILSLPVLNTAVALELTTPFMIENAQVLPKGIGNPRVSNLVLFGDSRFDGYGGREALGMRLSKPVYWGDVVNSQNTETERSLVRATVRDAQLTMNGSPGDTTGQVYTYANVVVPALAYGVSDRFTLAVAIPVLNVSVSADTGFSASPDGRKWMDTVCARNIDECNTAARKLNNAVNEKLTRLGYEPIRPKNVSHVGDAQVIGKYVVHRDPDNTLTVKSTLVLPTGIAPNADIALDVPTGDGRFQVGGMLIYDRDLKSDFKLSTYGGLLALMPNKMERRLPASMTDSLSADRETLTRQFGQLVSTGAVIQHLFPKLGLNAGVGYNFQFLSKTRYSGGSLYEAERYDYLEDLNPAQVLHTSLFTAGFSTVEWYRNKKFFYPLQANLVYSHPFLGRNVNATDVFSGEVVLFF
jgi:hypothetical protein